MIIDVHGHFTTTPPQVAGFRQQQVAEFKRSGQVLTDPPAVSDEEIRQGIEANQLRIMNERGVDLTIFSPRAIGMDHHEGNEATNIVWARYCNDLIDRACRLFPDRLVGVCQLPQAPGVRPGRAVIEELERCVNTLGFIGANLNPDPSGGPGAIPPCGTRTGGTRCMKRWWNSTCPP